MSAQPLTQNFHYSFHGQYNKYKFNSSFQHTQKPASYTNQSASYSNKCVLNRSTSSDAFCGINGYICSKDLLLKIKGLYDNTPPISNETDKQMLNVPGKVYNRNRSKSKTDEETWSLNSSRSSSSTNTTNDAKSVNSITGLDESNRTSLETPKTDKSSIKPVSSNESKVSGKYPTSPAASVNHLSTGPLRRVSSNYFATLPTPQSNYEINNKNCINRKDRYKNCELMLCVNDQEILIGPDDMPMQLFKELQDQGENPIFMVRPKDTVRNEYQPYYRLAQGHPPRFSR